MFVIVWDALRLEVGTDPLLLEYTGVHELPHTGAGIQPLIEPPAQILPVLCLCNCDLENLKFILENCSVISCINLAVL